MKFGFRLTKALRGIMLKLRNVSNLLQIRVIPSVSVHLKVVSGTVSVIPLR
jgi:hypothetical protein